MVNSVEKYELLLIAVITGLLGWFCYKVDQVDDKVEAGITNLTKQLMDANAAVAKSSSDVAMQRLEFNTKLEGRLDDLTRAVAEVKKSTRLR